MTDAITEKTVRDRLLRLLDPRKALIGINVCGIGPYGHEMDLVRVLPSGYAQEYEIKVTAADIKAEVKKVDKHAELFKGCVRTVANGQTVCRAYPDGYRWKVQQMEIWKPDQVGQPFEWTSGFAPHNWREMRCRYRGPIREFYVAVPSQELADVALALMPAWPGVVVMEGKYSSWEACVRRKAAKLPHHRKVTDVERQHLYHRMYVRYWDMYQGYGGAGRGGLSKSVEIDPAAIAAAEAARDAVLDAWIAEPEGGMEVV